MDIVSDHQTLLAEPAFAAFADESGYRPDWLGLRGRFAASFAARRVLSATNPVLPPVASGSFDAASARLISTYEEGLAAVNRTVLSNGKPDAGISAAVAGPHFAGGRG